MSHPRTITDGGLAMEVGCPHDFGVVYQCPTCGLPRSLSTSDFVTRRFLKEVENGERSYPATQPEPSAAGHGPGDGCGDLLWAHLEADPSFNEELRRGKAEITAGQGTPFRAVRAAAPSSPPGLDVEKIIRLAKDWRVSDEFIGKVVRSQFPREYARLQAAESEEEE